MFRLPRSISKFVFMVTLAFLFTGCAALTPRPRADYTDSVAGMDFVFVKGGTFEMGSTESASEQPIHSVTVQDMFVGMYELTFEQYDHFCDATGREKPGDEGWGRGNRPVINVTWHDANAYAAWLSKSTGNQYRLPTEAEWEYFARAGTTTAYWTGNSFPPQKANCRDCGGKWDNTMTAPVGSFDSNPWGIYDTAGNINEWVLGDFKRGYDDAPIDGTARTIPGTNHKSVRGGAWNYPSSSLRSASRDYKHTERGANNLGFRLVLIPTDTTPALNK